MRRRRNIAEVPSHAHHRARTIAIDGPAASGKSAVGSNVAARLRYRFLDTGAMYRAVAWLALRRGVDVADGVALVHLIDATNVAVRTVDRVGGAETGVLVDDIDATPHLRDPAVEACVSLVSRVPGVRSGLVRIQRELATGGEIVMAGRDIGTVVLPDADLKIYLDASREVRARRREQQLRDAGGSPDLAALIADLARRDGIDSTREASPLTAAADAVIINTDAMSIEEAVKRIVELAS